MIWPKAQPRYVVFGTASGKIRYGNTKSNKSQSMYNVGSYCVSMAASPDGNAFISGHADGTIYRFFFDDGVNGPQPHGVLCKHRCAPYALTWAQTVLASGPDKRLVVYDDQGRIAQNFDYSGVEEEREASVACSSPNGSSAVFGSYVPSSSRTLTLSRSLLFLPWWFLHFGGGRRKNDCRNHASNDFLRAAHHHTYIDAAHFRYLACLPARKTKTKQLQQAPSVQL